MDDDDLELIHTRGYDVRGYWRSDGTLVIRGAVRDELPTRFYDIDDEEPLVMHHMAVELIVELPDLVISDARVEFLAHPHHACPNVIDHYHHLVGLSIARGFTHKVRELFGGPRGCTHTTALLQAMAPVAMQCKLASRMMGRRRLGEGEQAAGSELPIPISVRERGGDPDEWRRQRWD